MKWYENRWLLLLPWLLVLVYAAYAVAGDYGQFQQDKTEQEQALREVRQVLADTTDAWVEQTIEIIEQYRHDEERPGIRQSLDKLDEENQKAWAELKGLTNVQFFPETLDYLYALAGKLERFSEIADGVFAAKTELIDTEARLEEAPLRIQYYADRKRYFWSQLDIINYYLTQEALAQSEEVLYELELRQENLKAKVERWQESFERERLAAGDDLQSSEDALRREAEAEYLGYLRARMRSFTSGRT
jgi:hypothetical protein